jgi:hypothetical protein
MRARMHGRIRSSAQAAWMPFAADQHNSLVEKTRLFYLDARMHGLPVLGYHRYVGAQATMDIRLLGLIPIQRAGGPELTRTETVTMFNDLCLLAPGALVDPAIHWTSVDARRARATFTNAGHTIQAELEFNDAGDLLNFWSDDRLQTTTNGSTNALRWSTPVTAYRRFGDYRLPTGGAACWHEPDGAYNYVELTFDAIAYDSSEEP